MEIVGAYEYSNKDLIGHGAFAVVFKGRHSERLDLVVAIKSITKKNIAKSQSLLGKEIKILKELTELHHENLVALYYCHETTSHVYLVMEYCNGGDLADYLQAKGTLSEDTIRFFLRQLADAMRALVMKGIAHRDLKPQNILLSHSGRQPSPPPNQITLKIADFGFARFLQDGVMAATLCGSPMYMAPEVIMSLQYDAKADLWSLGTIVFQCLTGKAPFQAQTPQALKNYYEKTVNLAPKIPHGTSPELTNLLMGLLKRNARDRMDFGVFFNHSFIRGLAAVAVSSSSSVKSSSQIATVPQPSSATNIKPLAADTAEFAARPLPPISPPPGLHPPPHELLTKETVEGVINSPLKTPFLLKQNANVTTSLSQEECDDFVMVPATLPSEADMAKGWCNSKPVNTSIARKTSVPASPTYLQRISPVPKTSPKCFQHHGVVGSGGSASSHSSSSNDSYKCSEPIPVPSHRAAYKQMMLSGSPEPAPNSPSVSDEGIRPQSQPISIRKVSESRTPDVASLSPPTVQFSIGTSSYGGRQRSYSNSSPSPPSVMIGAVNSGRITPVGSPLRHCERKLTPPHMPQICCAVPGLPAILDSPMEKAVGQDNANGDICGNIPRTGSAAISNISPFRQRTMSDLATQQHQLFSGYSFDSSDGGNAVNGSPLHRSRTDPYLIEWQTRGTPVPHSGNRQLIPLICPASGFTVHLPLNNALMPQDTVEFYAPPLNQETIMEKEHNETLAKLNFVLALVDCIIEFARSRASPINCLGYSSMRDSCSGLPRDMSSGPIPEWQRKVEQLVVYVKALQLLSSALSLAKKEKAECRLQPSIAVKKVVGILNCRFREVLNVCKELNSSGNIVSVDPKVSSITADKLIYNYAMEMCQNAALDELFGKPEDCFRRYQTAQILLHALAQQVAHDTDRLLLIKYKEAVEKRLFLLHEQGYINVHGTIQT